MGKVRTGLSICDENESLAVPLQVVSERNEDKLIEKITAIAKERKVSEIAFGLPKNMDGSEGDSAVHAREVGERLKNSIGLSIVFVDERGTTITAHNFLNDTNTRGKKRKSNVDAVAATIILQDYLNYRKNHI